MGGFPISQSDQLTVPCRLCQASDWRVFSSITFGVWKELDGALTRDSDDYPIGQCLTCGHVQVNCLYTPELLTKLYFHSKQEAIMWHESRIENDCPYLEMIAFASHDHIPDVMVDFGCGEGKLLMAARAIAPNNTLIGIDFNDRFALKGVDYLSYDLNELSGLPNTYWPSGIDLATASHVLEHVIDPVLFLTHIKSHLSNAGAIFIEVPDFSHRHETTSVGQSNLINLQHIHYFTTASLTYAAKQAGLQVVKLRQLTTGYIPRLQVLLKPADENLTESDSSSVDPVDTVSHYQSVCLKHRKRFVDVLLRRVELDGKAGIWGIGADFYKLISESSALDKAIRHNQIMLFDHALAGKRYINQIILSSTDIPQQEYIVFICPQLAETRIKMQGVSESWQNVRLLTQELDLYEK